MLLATTSSTVVDNMVSEIDHGSSFKLQVPVVTVISIGSARSEVPNGILGCAESAQFRLCLSGSSH